VIVVSSTVCSVSIVLVAMHALYAAASPGSGRAENNMAIREVAKINCWKSGGGGHVPIAGVANCSGCMCRCLMLSP